jgi:hypothetical protein
VRQHAERVDIVLLAELSKLQRLVALVAIKEEQPTRPNYLALCMLNKVLQLLNSKLVSRPTVVTNTNSLISRYILLVLGREVVPASKDNKRRDSPASNVDSLDYRRPLAISRLDSL